MSIDLRTVTITPLRHTFDHLVRRMGTDKPVSRYIEGTFDIQPVENFHYRPTWAPQYEIFDAGRTAISMKDWYALKDPRQYYYGAYTMARAHMQETAEAAFDFVESRELLAGFPAEVRRRALAFYLPLRHLCYASNINNSAIGAYGYGTAFTQAAVYYSLDQLGIAQYLTRLGISFGDVAELARAKQDWLKGMAWQGLRRLVENTFVQEDIFELFVAQDFVIDGMLYPLAYSEVDKVIAAGGGSAVSLMTRFQAEWFVESSKWVDALIQTAAAESDRNRELISGWTRQWRDRVLATLEPATALALPDTAAEAIARIGDRFNARALKLGLTV
jgi:phenol/toluene 2-monooxygenase (NADH) P1/A1